MFINCSILDATGFDATRLEVFRLHMTGTWKALQWGRYWRFTVGVFLSQFSLLIYPLHANIIRQSRLPGIYHGNLPK